MCNRRLTTVRPEDLELEANFRGIVPPQERTLAKYGISRLYWLDLIASQGWRCAVCHKSKAKWNTDHEHVPGWSKREPEERARYVRGILCWHCNRHVVHSNLSAADGRRLAEYLEVYEQRRDDGT